ncbi:hypothetical protein TNCV_1775321 [Trichonephila clavipes]|nr:hypothetical protein TNCV_1775321 [Trichonephila clavipes]
MTSTTERKVGGGRPRKIMASDYQYVVSASETIPEQDIFYLWSHVLYTDESPFSLNNDSQRNWIRRKVETGFLTTNIRERDRWGDPGALMWEGIVLNGRTWLHIFDCDSLTGYSYFDEVINLHS